MKQYIDHLVPINNVCNQKCNFCSAEYRMKWNKPIPMKQIFQSIMEKWNYVCTYMPFWTNTKNEKWWRSTRPVVRGGIVYNFYIEVEACI